MISVVVPLFNKEKFISETVRSVLDQSFPNFEMLVVNDGSTDTSVSVVEAFDDSRINIISIENSGVSVARNTAIKAAKYPWIAFLDGDDWWAPDFLKEMAGAIEKYTTHKLFASGRSRVFENATERYQHPLLPIDEATASLNYYRVIGAHLPLINSSNAIVHASLFEKRGFFKSGMKKHEDHDLWMRLAIDEDVLFVNKNLSFYRKTNNETASAGRFRATDFQSYLTTMISIKQKITPSELKYFKQYYNRYVVLAYLQNYGAYTKKERRDLMELIRKLLEGRSRFYINLIEKLPLQGLYTFYQKLRGR